MASVLPRPAPLRASVLALLCAGVLLLSACAQAPVRTQGWGSSSDSDMLAADPPICIAPAWAAWLRMNSVMSLMGEGDQPPEAPPAPEPLPVDDPLPPPPPEVVPGGEPAPVPEAPRVIAPTAPAPAPALPVAPSRPAAPPQAPPRHVVAGVEQGGACACPSLGWSYWSGSFDMVPGAGGSVTLGFVQERTQARERALELSFTWQDLWLDFSGEGQGGRYQMLRAGWAWRDDPCCASGWAWRAGVGLVMLSGRPRDIDLATVYFHEAGNYLGLYGGVGYEWRYGAWSHGPELQLFTGVEWDAAEVGVAGTARWTVTYRY